MQWTTADWTTLQWIASLHYSGPYCSGPHCSEQHPCITVDHIAVDHIAVDHIAVDNIAVDHIIVNHIAVDRTKFSPSLHQCFIFSSSGEDLQSDMKGQLAMEREPIIANLAQLRHHFRRLNLVNRTAASMGIISITVLSKCGRKDPLLPTNEKRRMAKSKRKLTY